MDSSVQTHLRTKRRRFWHDLPSRSLGAAFVLCLAALACSGPARSATFTVDSTLDAVDAVPGDGVCGTAAGDCTLRAAVMETNALAGADELDLPAGTYTLTLAGQGEDAAATGDLDIRDTLTIVGAGDTLTTIDAGALDRAFEAQDVARLTISDLTIRDGVAPSGGGSGISGVRTAIVLQRCALQSCADVAVFAAVTSLTLSDSTITGTTGGLGIYLDTSLLDIRNCVINGNAAGVEASFGSTVNAASTIFSNNNLGGALQINGGAATLSSCTVSGNHDRLGGGGATVREGASLVLTDTTFEANTSGDIVDPRYGGGAICLDEGAGRAERCAFRANSSGPYGGVVSVGANGWLGSFTAIECAFENNHAGMGGGGVFALGGGLNSDPRNTVTLTSCTFSGNTSDGPGGAVYVSPGGSTGDAWMTNCTLTGNRATDGGAIFAGSRPGRGQVRLAHCTIADNTATSNDPLAIGGGVAADSPSDVALVGCIAWGNTKAGAPSDLGGPITSLGWNLIGTTAGATLSGDVASNLVDVDPRLGPLQDNGGPTPTRAPLPASPAIDAANPAGCTDALGAPLLVDQRGVTRPADGNSDGTFVGDIGAVEMDCGPDSDGDGMGDTCDCAPADAGAFAIPAEPLLHVGKPPGSADAVVSWADMTPASGSATTADVASSTLQELLRVARVADGPCVATGIAGTSWRDARVLAAGELGFYYLVRGVNACGPAPGAGWGTDSLGVPHPACP